MDSPDGRMKNIVYFDLETHSIFRQIPTLDLMSAVSDNLGHRLSLDSAARATLGAEKTSDGMEAIRWYRQGKLMEIAEYCRYDEVAPRVRAGAWPGVLRKQVWTETECVQVNEEGWKIGEMEDWNMLNLDLPVFQPLTLRFFHVSE